VQGFAEHCASETEKLVWVWGVLMLILTEEEREAEIFKVPHPQQQHSVKDSYYWHPFLAVRSSISV
jgi:hypothetical protein